MLMRSWLAAIALVFTTSCEEPAPEIRIRALEITMEGAVSDVEVHVFDAASGEHLGCSDKHHGLEAVVASDTRYQLEAVVRLLHLDEPLRLDDVNGRELVFEVWQNRGPACPEAASLAAGDLPIGVSGAVAGSALDDAPLAFDGVAPLA
jgi:hypothetical protein